MYVITLQIPAKMEDCVQWIHLEKLYVYVQMDLKENDVK
jgi:hypothetical protein